MSRQVETFFVKCHIYYVRPQIVAVIALIGGHSAFIQENGARTAQIRIIALYLQFQRYFILNLAVADFILSLAGLQRGLGLVSPHLLIGGPHTSGFCTIFALVLNFVGYVRRLSKITT